MAESRNVTLHAATAILLTTFGYQAENRPVCYGFNYAAIIAALSPKKSRSEPLVGDMSTFVKRLDFIMQVYEQKDIPERVAAIRKKVITNASKKTQNQGIPADDISEEENKYLDLAAFLQRVNVFFEPQVYAKNDVRLFKPKQIPYTQQAETVFFMLQPETLVPKKLDGEHFQQIGIYKPILFHGVYNTEQFKTYCQLLQTTLEEVMSTYSNESIGIALKIFDHAIMLAYQDGQWIIVDSNFCIKNMKNSSNLPDCIIQNAEDMYQKIGKAFSETEEVLELNSISTEIYTTNPLLSNKIQMSFEALYQNNSVWRKMHQPTYESVHLNVPRQSNRITIATKLGDHLILDTLMQDPRFYPSDHIFFNALTMGHELFVSKLLTKPEHLHFDHKICGKNALVLAEERHMQFIMIRIVECEAERIKEDVPQGVSLIENILTALRYYLKISLEPNPQREKAINKILHVLDKQICTNSTNEERLIRQCKEKLQPILAEIIEDHKKQFKLPTGTAYSNGLFSLGNFLHPSKLASSVQAALDKVQVSSTLKQL